MAIRATDNPPETLVGRRAATIAWALYGRAADFPSPGGVDLVSLYERPWVALGDNLAALKAARFVRDRVPAERIVYKVNTVLGLAEAVEAGDVEQAKALFPVARTYWERIEPVAEIFGDLDPKIDGREEVVEEGMEFTGFHRLEKDLWVDGLQADSPAIADRLLSDIELLVDRAETLELTPLQLANGAKELLDETKNAE